MKQTLFLLGVLVLHDFAWLTIGADYDKIRLAAPARLDSGVPLEFGASTSTIRGDSSSVWIQTWDSHNPESARIGVIADHDGFSGIGAFDARNHGILWNGADRTGGPEPGDTISGVVHFYVIEGHTGPELWMAYEDDAGAEWRGFLATLHQR